MVAEASRGFILLMGFANVIARHLRLFLLHVLLKVGFHGLGWLWRRRYGKWLLISSRQWRETILLLLLGLIALLEISLHTLR